MKFQHLRVAKSRRVVLAEETNTFYTSLSNTLYPTMESEPTSLHEFEQGGIEEQVRKAQIEEIFETREFSIPVYEDNQAVLSSSSLPRNSPPLTSSSVRRLRIPKRWDCYGSESTTSARGRNPRERS